MPRGRLYPFEPIDPEPLLPLRAAAGIVGDLDPFGRVDAEGVSMHPLSTAGKQVDPVLKQGEFSA